MTERTFSIVKPDAVGRDLVGKIIAHFEEGGLRVRAMRLLRLSREQARGFYSVHASKPFFDSLVIYMTSGPAVVLVLEGEGAIRRARDLAGATNPVEAAEGTVRALYGLDVEKNSVHTSDSEASAQREIAFFRGALSWWS